ncbi:alpha/beta hydrolase [Pseudonocardia eucalypti]|uniref:Alpha/beta hydrolase n=1 Tax=Pseudonocardia eucalypti TaxID=648755 RepID=A0ABP9QEY8_9PSEU|nr:fermentation-respiration switch protein FrsA (DUF1100 family) [Pseudonocardia eucalypti]
MLRTALVLLAVLALAVGALWLGQRKLIYLPAGEPGPVSAAGPTAREVTLRTEDGLNLRAWSVGPTGADLGVHVLFAPGNAGNRGHRAILARRLAALGCTVLLLDYRGFGGNPGSPSEAGLAADARAARSYLLEHAGGPGGPGRLIYFGESLGAAVVTGLAETHPPAGLLLRSPFTDLASVAARHYPFLPVRGMLWDRFDVLGRIRSVRAPTVVVYGGADRVVPPEQSRAVASAAPGLLRAVGVPGADHNDDDLLDGQEIISAVRDLATG